VTDIDQNTEKAFDFAQEAIKQLITLATGVLALTITFLKDVIKKAPAGSLPWLQAAWILYLVSITFGVFALLNLSGVLERPGEDKSSPPNPLTPSIYRSSIRMFAIVQIIAFLVAVGLTITFGFKAF
jgi:nitrate reductase NapE component